MAASLRGGVTFVAKRYAYSKAAHRWQTALRKEVKYPKQPIPQLQETEEVVYPPIKPKYPPGEWGKISPRDAWKVHDKAEHLLQIPTIKMRLEEIAGPHDRLMPNLFEMKFIDPMPGTLSYTQYVTKTHIVEGLPDIYNSDENKSEFFLKMLSSKLEDELVHEVDQQYYLLDSGKVRINERLYFGHRIAMQLIKSTQIGMAHHVPHLQRTQIDEDVRLETYWRRCGFKDKVPQTKYADLDDVLDFQIKYRVASQLRTELPLPEILPVQDELCQKGEIPDFNYTPKAAGQSYYRDRPINISGHWVGDPCEFHLLSTVVPHVGYDKYIEDHGYKHIDSDSLGWGLTACFGSTVSQAFNQGFIPYMDLTYPMVTQVMVTDGQWFRFFTYQLNTVTLWKDNEANPTRNIMWASPRMKLYDAIEDNQVKGLNTDVFKQIIKCLLQEPQDRGVELRPYLPNETAPGLKKKFINHVGEEELPYHKIGQFEYPKNPVYF